MECSGGEIMELLKMRGVNKSLVDAAFLVDVFDTGEYVYTPPVYSWKQKLRLKFCGSIRWIIIKLDNAFLDGEFQDVDD
jgi:hypothetical protein